MLLLLVISLLACDEGGRDLNGNCAQAVFDMKRIYGECEKTCTGDGSTGNGDFKTSYVYWELGRSYTYTWGATIDGCKISTVLFPPIH